MPNRVVHLSTVLERTGYSRARLTRPNQLAASGLPPRGAETVLDVRAALSMNL